MRGQIEVFNTQSTSELRATFDHLTDCSNELKTTEEALSRLRTRLGAATSVVLLKWLKNSKTAWALKWLV